MKGKRSNSAGVIALLLIGAAGVYGIGVYVKRTPEAQQVAPSLHRSTNAGNPDSSHQATPPEKSTATIVTPHSKGGDLTFENTNEAVPTGVDPMVFAVNRFLQNSHIAPAEAKILTVDLKEGTLYLSCTESMEKTYGASDEAALLQGLQKTLSQFPNVKKAIFEVSGKAIETFGNVDISQGMDVTETDGSATTPGA